VVIGARRTRLGPTLGAAGKCVTAPKRGFGQDASTGVKHNCGAGGCTYLVPKGSEGCNLPVCVKSCPSPKYLLTAGPLGLGCAE
jgi:hypothetical protein